MRVFFGSRSSPESAGRRQTREFRTVKLAPEHYPDLRAFFGATRKGEDTLIVLVRP